MNLNFAPYIMSIIKAKTSFKGICECKHTPFRPFKNDIAFLQRPLTPFLGDGMDEEGHDHEHEDDNEGDDGHMAQELQHNMLCHLEQHSTVGAPVPPPEFYPHQPFYPPPPPPMDD